MVLVAKKKKSGVTKEIFCRLFLHALIADQNSLVPPRTVISRAYSTLRTKELTGKLNVLVA